MWSTMEYLCLFQVLHLVLGVSLVLGSLLFPEWPQPLSAACLQVLEHPWTLRKNKHQWVLSCPFRNTLWKVWTQESFHKYVEYDRPSEHSPECNVGLLLMTVTAILTTCVVIIFRVKVSCIMLVDGIKLWLLTWLVN